MTALTHFTATTTWQELTGVSDVAGIFTIQNRNSTTSCLIQAGDEPTIDIDALTLNPNMERLINNNVSLEKIWAKSLSSEVVITINKA